MAPKKEWFLHVDNANKGPLTLAEIRELLEASQITNNTLAWKSGMENWEPLHAVPDISVKKISPSKQEIEVKAQEEQSAKAKHSFLSDEEEFTLAEKISILSSLKDVNKDLPTQLSRSFPLKEEEEKQSIFILNEKNETIQEEKAELQSKPEELREQEKSETQEKKEIPPKEEKLELQSKLGGLEEELEFQSKTGSLKETPPKEEELELQSKLGGLEEKLELQSKTGSLKETPPKEEELELQSKLGGLEEKLELQSKTGGLKETPPKEEELELQSKLGGLEEKLELQSKLGGLKEAPPKKEELKFQSKLGGLKKTPPKEEKTKEIELSSSKEISPKTESSPTQSQEEEFSDEDKIWILKTEEGIGKDLLTYKELINMGIESKLPEKFFLKRTGSEEFLSQEHFPDILASRRFIKKTIFSLLLSKSSKSVKTITKTSIKAPDKVKKDIEMDKSEASVSLEDEAQPIKQQKSKELPFKSSTEKKESLELPKTNLKKMPQKIKGISLRKTSKNETDSKKEKIEVEEKNIETLKNVLKKRNTLSKDTLNKPIKKKNTFKRIFRGILYLAILAIFCITLWKFFTNYITFTSLFNKHPIVATMRSILDKRMQNSTLELKKDLQFTHALHKKNLHNHVIHITTNAAPGKMMKMKLHGETGKLINRVHFSLEQEKKIPKSQLLSFGPLKDKNNKPLPMGSYRLRVQVEGEKSNYNARIFLVAHSKEKYHKRMSLYKKKLQERYDRELTELRQLIQTMLSTHKGLYKKLNTMKTQEEKEKVFPSHKSWTAFILKTKALLENMDRSIQFRLDKNHPPLFYPSYYEKLKKFSEEFQSLLSKEKKIWNSSNPIQASNIEKNFPLREKLHNFLNFTELEEPAKVLARSHRGDASKFIEEFF